MNFKIFYKNIQIIKKNTEINKQLTIFDCLLI